jgi:hypothetical protein
LGSITQVEGQKVIFIIRIILAYFSVSKVVGFSLHKSGRLLIVLYENNMFRLWNLLDGRCHFKMKLGLEEDADRVKYKVL